jgi:hypothetical protein
VLNKICKIKSIENVSTGSKKKKKIILTEIGKNSKSSDINRTRKNIYEKGNPTKNYDSKFY